MNKANQILISALLLLFGYSAITLGCYLLDFYRSKRQISNLEQMMEEQTVRPYSVITDSGALPAVNMDNITPKQGLEMLPEFHKLYAENTDIIGWLKIDGTPVSYPVMQNQWDAEYYLKHGFDKKENQNGLPFLDIRSNIFRSSVLLIHGHSMKTGHIFGELLQYTKKDYYEEHPVIQFSSLYEKADYRIMAVILSKVYPKSEQGFKYYQIEETDTEAGFNRFVLNVKSLSLYETGISSQFGDTVVVLSTCEYSVENGRLAVIVRKDPS